MYSDLVIGGAVLLFFEIWYNNTNACNYFLEKNFWDIISVLKKHLLAMEDSR